MIVRALESVLRSDLNRGKVIVLLGPRQVGKTTLVRKIASEVYPAYRYLNGDLPATRQLLSSANLESLSSALDNSSFVVLDEAQRIDDIGLKLKTLIDRYPDRQLLVTGSSALELAYGTHEPLTGRKYVHHLYPISYAELVDNVGSVSALDQLSERLIYGSYPEVINEASHPRRHLDLIVESYLYKDLLGLPGLRRVDLLQKILQALAFQVGSEVSYPEIGRTVDADKQTVERYIDLLEKAYVIFRLPSLSRNLRTEIKRGRKVYFWDNGVRNALISNFSPPTIRQDMGALWENFLVSERLKAKSYQLGYANHYFWRTHGQQEIDYIEERDGQLTAYEFKWSTKKKTVRFPKTFRTAYPNAPTVVVTPHNFIPFVSDWNQDLVS